jgi:hypothetical protein
MVQNEKNMVRKVSKRSSKAPDLSKEEALGQVTD